MPSAWSRAIFVLTLLASATFAHALEVTLGWSGFYRPGDWNPVFVTVPATPDLRGGARATLEVRAWLDARGSVAVASPVVLQGRAVTWSVPGLLGGTPEGTGVLVRDSTGKVVSSRNAGSLANTQAQAITSNTRLAALVGPADRPVSVLPGEYVGGFTPVNRLPERAELYAPLDVLIFTGSTLADVSPAAAAAIEAWVRSGGTLVVCVPAEGLEPAAALTALLPARVIGEVRTVTLGTEPLAARNLAPAAGAVPLDLGDGLTGFSADLGMGKLRVAPVSLSAATRGTIGKLLGEYRPRVSLEWPVIPDQPARFPWLAVGIVLLVGGLLLGPVEAVVRRGHEAWPWRGWVIAGVVAMAGGGAILLAQTEPRLTTSPISLTDQVDGVTVAVTSLGKGDEGFARVLEPLRVDGTDHSASRLRVDTEGRVRVDQAPGWSAILATRVEPGPAVVEVTEHSPAGRSAKLGVLATVALLETREGVFTGTRTPDGTWQFDQRLGPVLPPEFQDLRRLTPLRSAQLQDRVSAGTATLLWTRDDGGRYTRTFLPSRP